MLNNVDNRDIMDLESACGLDRGEISEILFEGIRYTDDESSGNKPVEYIKFEDLIIYTQPLFSLKDDKPIAAEVLIRSCDNRVTAEEVLTNMKKTNRIHELDLMIIEKVCSSRLWEKLGVQRVNINLSAETLEMHKIAYIIVYILKKYNAINNITLELNEDTLYYSDVVMRNIQAMVDSNIQISLDDFNVSLGWITVINKYGIQELKYKYNDNTELRRLKTLETIASALRIRLVIEKVPDNMAMNELKNLDIDIVQSYITGRPAYALKLVS